MNGFNVPLMPIDYLLDFFAIFRREVGKGHAHSDAAIDVHHQATNLNGMFIRIDKLKLKVNRRSYLENGYGLNIHPAGADLGTANRPKTLHQHLLNERDSPGLPVFRLVCLFH